MADFNILLMNQLMGADRDKPQDQKKILNYNIGTIMSVKISLFHYVSMIYSQIQNTIQVYVIRNTTFFQRNNLNKITMKTNSEKLNEVEVIIKKNKVNQQFKLISEIPTEIQEQVYQIEDQIKKLLNKSVVLGEEGQMEQSEELSIQAEMLIKQKDDMIKYANDPIESQKEIKIYDICGGQQSILDTDKKIQTHLEGKIHKGFLVLREQLSQLKIRKQELDTFSDQYYSKQKGKSESNQSDSSNYNKKLIKSRSRSKDYRRNKHYNSSSTSQSRSRYEYKKYQKRSESKYRNRRRYILSSSSESRSNDSYKNYQRKKDYRIERKYR